MTKLEYDQKRAAIMANPTFSVKEKVKKLAELADARKAAADKIGRKK